MPTDPLQLTLTVLEYTIVFGGAGLTLWLLFDSHQRQRWLGPHSLPQISLSLAEFALAAALILLAGVVGSALAQTLLGSWLTEGQNHNGIKLLIIGVANYGGGLLAWRVLVPFVLRSWPASPPARSTRQKLSWSESVGYGVGALLVALPIVILVSLAWLALLRSAGLPDEPQPMVADFLRTKSPYVIAGMLIVACVLAPIYEELLFRAGLYRYLRQKLGRTPALLVSGTCFGAMHANWAGLVPLAVLGLLLALAYEATGSIRVPIIAHGLFNLNTIILLLAGLTQANP